MPWDGGIYMAGPGINERSSTGQAHILFSEGAPDCLAYLFVLRIQYESNLGGESLDVLTKIMYPFSPWL